MAGRWNERTLHIADPYGIGEITVWAMPDGTALAIGGDAALSKEDAKRFGELLIQWANTGMWGSPSK